MAKKVVFNSDIIIQKAFDFVIEKGIDSLSARELAKYIGCSTQPLFKAFKNMDDIKDRLEDKMDNYYINFAKDIISEEDYLFTKNYAYIIFALKEPNLFKALFLNYKKDNMIIEEWMNYHDNNETIEKIAKKMFIPNKQARRLYRDVLLYSHGIACQLAYKNLLLSENDIKILLKNIIRQMNQAI